MMPMMVIPVKATTTTVETEYLQSTIALGSYGNTTVKIKLSYNNTNLVTTIKGVSHVDNISSLYPLAYVSSITQ